jgi:hypothetical protein
MNPRINSNFGKLRRKVLREREETRMKERKGKKEGMKYNRKEIRRGGESTKERENIFLIPFPFNSLNQ